MSTSLVTQVPTQKPIPSYIDITRAVDSFVVMGKSFSAYDVVKKLRATLGSDYYISHSNNKDTIHSIMADYCNIGSYGRVLFSDDINTFQLYYSQAHIPSTIDSFESVPQVTIEATSDGRFQVPANMIKEMLNVLYKIQEQNNILMEECNLVKVNGNYFIFPIVSDNVPYIFFKNVLNTYSINQDSRLRFKVAEEPTKTKAVLTFICYNNFPCIKIDLV